MIWGSKLGKDLKKGKYETRKDILVLQKILLADISFYFVETNSLYVTVVFLNHLVSFMKDYIFSKFYDLPNHIKGAT